MAYVDVKKKLREGGLCPGLFMGMDHPGVADIVSRAGFDWVLCDQEHGHFTLDSLRGALNAMRGAKSLPIVRVPESSGAFIKQALDLGVGGIMAPMVLNRSQAESVVDAMLYPPKGSRSLGFSRCNGYGRDMEDLLIANEQILTVIQIEHIKAIEKIDEIASVPGIDVLFIGPYDLSCSLGLMGQITHPEVEKAISHVFEAAKAHGVALGMYCRDRDHARKMVEQGVQFYCYVSDYQLLRHGAERAARPL